MRAELTRWVRVLLAVCAVSTGGAAACVAIAAVIALGSIAGLTLDAGEPAHKSGLAALFTEENPFLVGVARIELGAPPGITIDNRGVEFDGTIETIPARLTLVREGNSAETLLIACRAGSAVRAEDQSVPSEFLEGVSRGAIERWLARESPETERAVLSEIATRLAAQLGWLQGVALVDPLQRPQSFLLPPVRSGRGQPEAIGFTFGPRFASAPPSPPEVAPTVFLLFAGSMVGLLVAGAVSPVFVTRERQRRHAHE